VLCCNATVATFYPRGKTVPILKTLLHIMEKAADARNEIAVFAPGVRLLNLSTCSHHPETELWVRGQGRN
jgi:hypothetical protein